MAIANKKSILILTLLSFFVLSGSKASADCINFKVVYGNYEGQNFCQTNCGQSDCYFSSQGSNVYKNSTCTNACPHPTCGNSNTEPGEQCDDGNTENGDGCNSNCQSE